jgi:imidazolonepropionase-like amidohydrolase
MFQAFAPGIMPLTVEEGIADGVSQRPASVGHGPQGAHGRVVLDRGQRAAMVRPSEQQVDLHVPGCSTWTRASWWSRGAPDRGREDIVEVAPSVVPADAVVIDLGDLTLLPGLMEVRRAVRYQIKHGARLIKVCASGGVMSHTGPAGAQQYSDEELCTIADEAHRAGLKVAAHAHGDDGIRAAIEAGIDCIEHGSLMSDETLDLMIERGTFLVPTTYLADGMDVSHAAPELQAKAAEVFPRAKETIRKAVERGARIACGTDAPAIPHGKNAKELLALVDRGMTPLQAIRAATTVAADLIDVDDRGRLEAGLLADIIAVPGDPLAEISVTEDVRFVMKGGQVYLHDEGAR